MSISLRLPDGKHQGGLTSYVFHQDVDIVIRASADGFGVYGLAFLGLCNFYRLERPMLNFSSEVPDNFSGSAFQIKRTPAKSKLLAIATSDNFLGTPTHFWGGHTVPCEAPDCPACQEGSPWRWHGYITALDPKTGEHFIFEFTAQAAETFDTYRNHHGTLRGCFFEASRRGQYRNGRLLLRCKPADLAQVNLPEAPDLLSCLCYIWHVDKPEGTLPNERKNVDRPVTKRKLDGNNKPVRQTQPVT